MHPRYVRVGEHTGIDCDRPVLILLSCGAYLATYCASRSSADCVPCSWRYRRLLARKIDTGMTQAGHFYLLTLTAPGDRLHHLPSGAVCPCTPEGGTDLGTWNPSAGRLWNRFRTELRRQTPELEFSRHVELQKRGAIHLHVIVRSPVPLDRFAIRRLAMRCGFGHSSDLSPIASLRAARAYVTKAVTGYVTKAVSDRQAVPWDHDVVDLETGEIRAERSKATYRITSSSRSWGMTLKAIKAAQADHRERTHLHRAMETLATTGLLSEPVAASGPEPPT